MKIAVRALARTPAFSAMAIATMALGIAANTAIFSVVNAVLLRPLPFRDESRIVKLVTVTRDEPDGNHSAGGFLDIQQGNRSLQAMAGVRVEVAAVSLPGRDATQLVAAWATTDFFDVLGTPPALGRTFSPRDPAGERTVVLSHAAWLQLFGGSAAVVGRPVRINGEPWTVVAVMPEGFAWPRDARLWLRAPLAVPPSPIDVDDPLTNRDVSYFQAIARLKPGVTLTEAGQDLHALAVTLQERDPARDGGRDLRPTPIRQDLVGAVRQALLVLQGAVGLVLLIACANVSSLLIARATGRRREMAIRAALGAGRGRLVRQLLTESLVLGVAGGAVGLVLSIWLLRLLVRFLPPGMPRADAIAIDPIVLMVTLLASLGAAILFGILPALQASQARAVHALKEAGTRSSARARGRAALVVVEIALTLVLLVGAGLLANSFVRLQRVAPGFQPAHATVAGLLVPQTRYPKGADQTRFYRRLLEELGGRPGLQAVGLGFPGPFHASSAGGAFYIEGQTYSTRAERPYTHLASVSGGYFAAMGIPILAGRTFDDRDDADAAPVALVSTSLARRYWPGVDPIGRRFRFEGDSSAQWATVVGLVDDVRQLGLGEEAPALMYFPYAQFPLPFTTVVVRSELPTDAVVSVLRTGLASLDRDVPFGNIATLQSEIDRQLGGPRFRAILVGLFAGLALMLAAVGLFGLISYSVAQRTREIGIRVALGAAPGQVLSAIVRQGVTLALAGIGLGLAAAAAAARLLGSFLFGIGTTDPLTFGAVALLLFVVAVGASLLPARRAVKVDPVTALRAE